MLTTSRFSLKKPQTSDAPSALRTAISDNADILDPLLDARAYAEVLTSQTTTSTTAADLTTVGPSVTLTVPANGLVVVRAQVECPGASAAPLRVYLAEDGISLGTIIDATAGQIGGTAPGLAAGITSPRLGSWLVFPATAGSRTYKLMYSNQGGANAAGAQNRKLWVRVKTF